MGFLDIYPQEQERAAKFQPYEGTRLPGYYELHREEILIGSEILVAAVLLVAAFYYRAYLRNALIIVLVGVLRMCRKAAAMARLFWREVEDRAD
jgi:hypothetical protein